MLTCIIRAAPSAISGLQLQRLRNGREGRQAGCLHWQFLGDARAARHRFFLATVWSRPHVPSRPEGTRV